jgi:hypothetical protein
MTNNQLPMTKIKILHLEDNPDDSELILSAMESGGLEVDYTRVENEQAFLQALKNTRFDMILADYHLPSYNGIAALKACSDNYSEIPFILISGTLGEEIAVTMLKYGAADYLLKQNLKRLVPAIEHALAETRLRQQKQKAEEELRKSEEKYRKIFENIQDVFFQVGNDGLILEVSPSIFRMNGYSSDEMKGKNAAMLCADPKDFYTIKDIIEREGEVWDFEVSIKTKEGLLKYVSVNAHNLYNDNNILLGIEGSARDIDARKRAEAALIEAKERAEESDRLKSAFLANISHEIRTPMNGILGFASLLKEPLLKGEQQQKYINIIENSGERMLTLINQIMDISKIESGLMKVSVAEVNIKTKMEDLYTFFRPEAEKKKLAFSYTKGLPDQLPFVHTDPEKLYAVLSNLINNALKYTKKGAVEFGCHQIEDKLEFFVKDTGIGILPDKMASIFDRFVQADLSVAKVYEGAGLGLSISKAYVEMQGGKIWAESVKGNGSTFYFTLPV